MTFLAVDLERFLPSGKIYENPAKRTASFASSRFSYVKISEPSGCGIL